MHSRSTQLRRDPGKVRGRRTGSEARVEKHKHGPIVTRAFSVSGSGLILFMIQSDGLKPGSLTGGINNPPLWQQQPRPRAKCSRTPGAVVFHDLELATVLEKDKAGQEEKEQTTLQSQANEVRPQRCTSFPPLEGAVPLVRLLQSTSQGPSLGLGGGVSS